ncbi:hypothetical protein ACP70R_015008 [Stipagrostis hirtigluma subsp. patula]
MTPLVHSLTSASCVVRSAMDCPKKASAAAAGFPDDPLVEILSRLRAKPLFRFKCVSKAWCGLIADRLGRRKFPQTLEGFFFLGGGGVNNGHLISLLGRSDPLIDASFSFLSKVPGTDMALLGSHNGLLLFGITWEGGSFGYIVCNPATQQRVAVPSSGFTPCPPLEKDDEYAFDFRRAAHHFLIFDPAVSSHFHLVQFWHYRCTKVVEYVCVYSSETGVWRGRRRGLVARYGYGEARQFQRMMRHEDQVEPKLGRADVNGMLHIPVYHFYGNQPEAKEIQIDAVDMEGKTCRSIRWPDKNEFVTPAFIGQSQGLMHCINKHEKQEGCRVHINGLSIWVLEDYDQEQWVLKRRVSCSQLFGEIDYGIDDLVVVAIHPDRNLIFFVHHYDQKLISYDMDSEEVCTLRTLGHDCQLIVPYVSYFGELSAVANRH